MKTEKTTRINFHVTFPKKPGEKKGNSKNDKIDVPGNIDDKDFSDKARALIKERYPEGMCVGMAPTFGHAHYRVGDLLNQDDIVVIAHQANCLKAMYSGIAGAIREVYPFAVQADIDFPLSAKARFGWASCGTGFGSNGLQKRIYNLYGQFAPGTDRRMTDYNKLQQALETMMHHLDDIGIPDEVAVGVPYKIGCGLAGGDWKVVVGILRAVANEYCRDIYIYVLPQYAGEVFENGETETVLPRWYPN
jgi:O-acetyl-ADP-ribose deacetylase (regulator of RNase III)